jgi:hypothetical protein
MEPMATPVDRSGPLVELAWALAEAGARLTNPPGPVPPAAAQRVRAAIQSTVEALSAARARAGAGRLDAEARDAYLHGLRGPANTIVGWVHVVTRTDDARTWARGIDAIERSAKALVERLTSAAPVEDRAPPG